MEERDCNACCHLRNNVCGFAEMCGDRVGGDNCVMNEWCL